MKQRISLFITALMQVMFVAMSQVFISKDRYILMLITGFMISLIWTFNVKRAAFGDLRDKIIYATGAMFGTGVGYLLANYLMKII